MKKLNTFEEYILKNIESVIELTNEKDIYILTFLVSDEGEYPCIMFGYNTEKQYLKSIEKASSKEEARWNYAFWIQNTEFEMVIDEFSNLLVKKFAKEKEEELQKDLYSSDLLDEVKKSLVKVVREVHESGIIKNKLGMEIPIVIHSFTYRDGDIKRNVEANGLELVDEFINESYGSIKE